ncbi:MAG: hypothetical protein ACREP9_21395 [Candidatus Dormibacteraceae bacterium]
MAKETSGSPGLIWRGADLPRIAPGDYQAVCTSWQGPEWVKAYRRWSLRVEFCLLSEDQCVSAFFNMGNDRRGPDIGRRSRFYAVWSLANGEPPRKGQQMALEVLTDEGLTYLVRVADALKDGKDEIKPDVLVYSRVTEVLKVERP